MMRVNEWSDLHKDVNVLLETEKREMVFIFKMQDNETKDVVERKIPFNSMPFEQEEIVLEDYICSVLEQMHHELRSRHD